jgi:predicted O-methyltransferase YrrM
MIRFIKDFLFHRFTAKTRHGIHSPFVYKLTDEVIYDRRPGPDYAAIERIRKSLLQDQRVIEVTDLGAGSRLDPRKRKKISEIAKNALKPPRLAQLLYRLAKSSQPETIVELGTCLGITTSYFAHAVPSAQVISVEGCPQTSAVAAGTLQRTGSEHVTLLTGNFDVLFPGIVSGLDRIDFVFIDGNHRKQATLDYFRQCLPKVHEHTLLIFDDIYWSEGMKEAWEEIRAHPQVTLTIDLFWIGLVYFRKGQAKEHFKVRY